MSSLVNLELLDNNEAQCPVPRCQLKLKPLELLTHLLMFHRPEQSMLEVGPGWHTVYFMELAKLKPNCNHVVAVMAYAGSTDSTRSRPVGPELQLVHHLPLILMLYVSPLDEQLEQLYVLYLVSLVASSSVSARVCLLNDVNGREVRGQRCLRSCLQAPLQDSSELLHSNLDYLVYTATDVWEHCSVDESHYLKFKVTLQGEPNIFEQQQQPTQQPKQ
ncbi:uncharacterized protein LOC108607701 [Drosophila busckii]|uniref:uncharacterized protein LOC108607701 n=1 Tax=Drosophila busckii TaxID=30019 RepID=UPI00083EBE8C|nr:uncharacterized protein LOC108607701 [Drosophila busckii]